MPKSIAPSRACQLCDGVGTVELLCDCHGASPQLQCPCCGDCGVKVVGCPACNARVQAHRA